MNDRFLKQFAPRHAVVAAPNEAEAEPVDDFAAFGYLRGVRDRAFMLEFRRKDGSVTAFGYAWLEKVEFDPSSGLTLHFGRESIRLSGRNLNAEVKPNVCLLDGIVRHKVPYVQESGRSATFGASPGAVVIECIEIV